MTTKTSQWFECKVRYNQMQETGLLKKVTEQFVVEALSYTEAEAAIIKEMKPFVSGDFEIAGIKPAAYRDVCFSEDTQAGLWFKAKLAFITIDEKSGKEKRTPMAYLVQATSLDNAVQNIGVAMQGTMIDYAKSSVAETKILDVFEHRAAAEHKADDLMSSMADELKDRSKSVVEIADKYVRSATPELRQQLIDKLTAMREDGTIPQE